VMMSLLHDTCLPGTRLEIQILDNCRFSFQTVKSPICDTIWWDSFQSLADRAILIWMLGEQSSNDDDVRLRAQQLNCYLIKFVLSQNKNPRANRSLSPFRKVWQPGRRWASCQQDSFPFHFVSGQCHGRAAGYCDGLTTSNYSKRRRDHLELIT
jgi:hypothetical protein